MQLATIVNDGSLQQSSSSGRFTVALSWFQTPPNFIITKN